MLLNVRNIVIWVSHETTTLDYPHDKSATCQTLELHALGGSSSFSTLSLIKATRP